MPEDERRRPRNGGTAGGRGDAGRTRERSETDVDVGPDLGGQREVEPRRRGDEEGPRGRTIEGGIDLAGSVPLSLGADVTSELKAAAPVFGDVLKAVGLAVAASQAALDRGVAESARALSDEKVKVVTDVVTTLDDDGQPVSPKTVDELADNLRTVDVSALNFFTPTVHEWKHMALSMDLAIGELDAKQGVKFNRSQASVGIETGVHWGFGAWFAAGSITSSYRRLDVEATSSQETDWAQGSVRVDAELGPRRTANFPVPGRVERGPTVFLNPGKVTTDSATATRRIVVTVTSRKGNGEANGGKQLAVSSPGIAVAATGADGMTTDTQGRVSLRLEKSADQPPTKHSVTVDLGALRKTFEIAF